MKNMFFVLFSAFLFSSCAGIYITNTGTFGHPYPSADQQNYYSENYCNGTPVPVCNNSGISKDNLRSNYEVVTFEVNPKYTEINNPRLGAYINGRWRDDCVYTINLMVHHPIDRSQPAKSCSIPISESQMYALENGQSIQVSVVW